MWTVHQQQCFFSFILLMTDCWTSYIKKVLARPSMEPVVFDHEIFRHFRRGIYHYETKPASWYSSYIRGYRNLSNGDNFLLNYVTFLENLLLSLPSAKLHHVCIHQVDFIKIVSNLINSKNSWLLRIFNEVAPLEGLEQ